MQLFQQSALLSCHKSAGVFRQSCFFFCPLGGRFSLGSLDYSNKHYVPENVLEM